MTPSQLSSLLVELLSLPQETEWVEWKHNHAAPDSIAEYVSALSNSAALHDRQAAYLIWGIEDGGRAIVGTNFKPRQTKKGNEELENWLLRSLHPQVNFRIHEWAHEGKSMVLLEIPRATNAPVRFGSEEFIRVGSLKKKLKDYPAKEAELWAAFSRSLSSMAWPRPMSRATTFLGCSTLIDASSCWALRGHLIKQESWTEWHRSD